LNKRIAEKGQNLDYKVINNEKVLSYFHFINKHNNGKVRKQTITNESDDFENRDVVRNDFMTLQKNNSPQKSIVTKSKRRTCSTGIGTNLGLEQHFKSMTPASNQKATRVSKIKYNMSIKNPLQLDNVSIASPNGIAQKLNTSKVQVSRRMKSNDH